MLSVTFLDTPPFSHINFIHFVLILHPFLHWTPAPPHSSGILYSLTSAFSHLHILYFNSSLFPLLGSIPQKQGLAACQSSCLVISVCSPMLLLRRAQTSELPLLWIPALAVPECSLETHHNQPTGSTQKLLFFTGYSWLKFQLFSTVLVWPGSRAEVWAGKGAANTKTNL